MKDFLLGIDPQIMQFGPLLTLIVTIIAGVIVYWVKINSRRSTIRLAFIRELESNHKLDAWVNWREAKIEEDNFAERNTLRPFGCPYTTTVYENNVGEIGILSEKEVNLLVNFYSLALTNQRQLEAISNYENSWRGVEKMGLSGRDTVSHPNEEVYEVRNMIEDLNKNLTELVELRKKAIKFLKERSKNRN